MAKKLIATEKPFSVLDKFTINSVQNRTGATFQEKPQAFVAPVAQTITEAKILDVTTEPEIIRRTVPVQQTTATTTTPNYTTPSVTSTPQNLSQLVEKLDQEKRILLTKKEAQKVDRLVTNLAMQLNTSLKASHLMRSAITLLMNAEENLIRRAGEFGTLTRPSNGDAQGMQKFERELATLIAKAIIDSGGMR